MKIYVASSWSNGQQPSIVQALRDSGHEVYDFRNPEPGNTGFSWGDISWKYPDWTPSEIRDALSHHIAVKSFNLSMNALEQCDICVLVLPCNRSAHLEAGWAIGAGKPVLILLNDGEPPELMYKMTPYICLDVPEMLACVEFIAKRAMPITA